MALIGPLLGDTGHDTRVVPGGDRAAHIVLFPHAGSSPRALRHLATALPAHRVSAVTYPGRDHLLDMATIPDIRDLAETVAAELCEDPATDHDRATAPSAGPLMLFGHSLGAYVAYETAAALSRARAADSTAPSSTILVVSGQNPPLPRPIDEATWPATDDEIVSDIVRQNPSSAEVWSQPELRSFFLPAARADYRLLRGYVPGGTTVEQVHVVVGDRDEEVDSGRLPRWQEFSRRRITITTLSGGHLYLESPDTQLAEVLERLLIAPPPSPSPAEPAQALHHEEVRADA
jgi:pyochelin biosynthetic protein PchC